MLINDYTHKFIENQKLKGKNVKLLLAVSGGLDSMAMLYAFHKQQINIAVATINYKLRPHADLEAKVVQTYCHKHKIVHHLKICSEQEVRTLKSSNLQEKARDIRYAYFDLIMKTHHYSHVMMAHHADDLIEGFFLALKRGSGLSGLSQMNEVNGHIMRPFLRFSKNDLFTYANDNQINYEEDESNRTNEYDRNYIRNEVIPLLTNRFPSFSKAAIQSITHLKNADNLLEYYLKKEEEQYLLKTDEGFKLKNINAIKALPGGISLMFHFLQPLGFNSTQAKEVMISNTTGALWKSEHYEATLHQNELIINKLKEEPVKEFIISDTGTFKLENGYTFSIKKVEKCLFEKAKNIEYVDGHLLSFPLTMRRWKPGDVMQPFGMEGKSKKIQDILTDAKVNRLAKKQCYVMCSDQKIVWLVNIRLDERFKVSKKTSDFIKIQYTSKETNDA